MKTLVYVVGFAAVSANLQPGEKPPVAHTYHNAYGTHFDVSSTWTLLLGVYVVFVVGGFMLLSVVPVRFATNEKMEAPFVLWFGSAKKKKKKGEKHVEKKPVKKESVWQQASSWLIQTLSRFFATAPGRDTDVRYRFHADMTQQLAVSAATVKTYESIAIVTEDKETMPSILPQISEDIAEATYDLKMKPPPPQEDPRGAGTAVVEPETSVSSYESVSTATSKVESRPSRNLTRPSSRSSIFVSAPPSPPSVGRMQQRSTRLASDASSVKAESIGRHSRANSGASVVETKEDFVRAASRRQSMAVRAERRVTFAREDVSYENLEDDEMQVYEYLEFIRELLDGLALKKLCQKSGRVVSRKLYITADMQVVFWNSIGAIKRQTRKSSIRTELIESVERGVHGSAKVVARSTPEREALCVSIRCRDGKWLVLEAKTEAMRQRLFLGFTRLAQEKHEQEAAASSPMQATIPEDVEAEEELDEGEEEKTQVVALAESQVQMMSRISEASLEREERRPPVTEAHESESVGQQPDYEEKAPPPALEEELLRHELLSIRASYDQANDSDIGQGGNDPGDERTIGRGSEEQVADIRERDVLHAVPTPSNEDDKSSRQHEERQQQVAAQREEGKAEERVGNASPAVDDDDIDNLSDDPELSRE
ncbi:hypothetical protein PC121_g1420 [Phytophthora cactorum]|nr:hypothetical protein PC120_g71 [Phytophthora cactorum]KAG3101349.1 hypothetical protein PC121_g1420 [Phytophthora cactorum]KAG4064725.1 hypothetical protein PC123_g483 [Phytophthora cactorum]